MSRTRTRQLKVRQTKTDDQLVTELSQQPWFNRYWRPAMLWQYFAVCISDFLLLPIVFQAVNVLNNTTVQWDPITLRGGGMYHVSMLGIIGIYIWGKSQERLQMMRDPEWGSTVVRHELQQETRMGGRGFDPDLSTPAKDS